MLLVIPTEVLPSKQHFPWLSISCAIILISVFVMFQTDDNQELNDALNFYQASELFVEEVELFKTYKNTEQGLNSYMDLSVVDTDGPRRIYLMVLDHQFREFVAEHKRKDSVSSPEDFARWQSFNNQLNTLVKKVTYINYGVSTQNQSLSRLFSYQFLHSGWPHLIGNLVFLLIFATGVELMYGRLSTVAIFLTSGIAGGALFTQLAGSSFAPLIGASASISGLMGAYASYFGSRKINFFAWFGVYFNNYQWPAFMVLLFWLLKELIFQVTDAESGVAYLAHFGGLVAGALLGFLIRLILPFTLRTKLTVANDDGSSESTQNLSSTDSQKQRSEQLYQAAQASIRDLDFNTAKTDLRKSLELNPNNLDAIKSFYHIVKLQPASSDFQFILNTIFEQPIHLEQWDTFCLAVANDHPECMVMKRLSIESFFNFMHRQLRNDRVDLSTTNIEQAKKYYAQQQQLPKLLYQWGMALAKRNRLRSALREFNYLANYYGETSYGKAAIEQLKRVKN